MKTKLLNLVLNEDWGHLVSNELNEPYFLDLMGFLKAEYQNETIFPRKEEIFAAFNYKNPQEIKLVVLGQDPYHGFSQANGLSFSVPQGLKLPPSLKNIIKELKSDVDIPEPMHGDLSNWASQGILLLNTCLTVRAHEPLSHQNKGWEKFTDQIIKLLSESNQNIIFLLWGKKAEAKKELIAEDNFVLISQHPSPLSAYRGFFGCKHFSEANKILLSLGKEQINWEII
jgi:uracil-DNA glycosylase